MHGKLTTFGGFAKAAQRIFLDAVFPEWCLFCGAEGALVCPSCLLGLPFAVLHGCPFCDRVSMFGKTCDPCSNKTPLAGVFCFGLYHNPRLRQLVWALKYHGKRDLANLFALKIAALLPGAMLGEASRLMITAVPLHPTRRRERGYNQSELIARAVGQCLAVEYDDLLDRVRSTAPQVELTTVADRLENVRAAFGILDRVPSERIVGRSVLLVDDVVTTGATLTACARALKKAGAQSVWGLTILRG